MNAVQLLGQGDLGEVLTLQRAAFALEVIDQYPNYEDPLRQTLTELVDEQAEPGAATLGVREGHRLIGAIRVLPLPGDVYYLARLSVAPDKTKQGLGQILMQAAIEHVRENIPQARRIQFRADGSNNWLIRWYEDLGFTVIHPGSQHSRHDWTLAMDLLPPG